MCLVWFVKIWKLVVVFEQEVVLALEVCGFIAVMRKKDGRVFFLPRLDKIKINL
jgi:hypothetical protein